jgi:hypothetical protein
MQDTGLFKNWILQGLLDELDAIERFESPEHGRLIGEVTQKQKDIYVKLGVESLLLITFREGLSQGSFIIIYI